MIFVKPAVCRYPERLQRKRKRARNGRVSAWAAGVPVAGVGPRRFDRRTARTQYRYFRVRFERVEKPISGDFGGLKKGKAVVDFAVENAFLKRAMSGDTTAQIFWLKNRRPDLWRDRQQHEHSGPDGKPMQVEDVSDIEAARRVAFLLTKAAKAKD